MESELGQGQRALNAVIAPVGILLGKLNTKIADDRHFLLPCRVNFALGGVFIGNQAAMPSV